VSFVPMPAVSDISGEIEEPEVRPVMECAASARNDFCRRKRHRKSAETPSAVGQRRVPADFLKKTIIPLPPVPEQRRIVSKIDSLSGKSKRAREQLDHIPRLETHSDQLIRVRQTILEGADHAAHGSQVGISVVPGEKEITVLEICIDHPLLALGGELQYGGRSTLLPSVRVRGRMRCSVASTTACHAGRPACLCLACSTCAYSRFGIRAVGGSDPS
jgi:hypothetical protein